MKQTFLFLCGNFERINFIYATKFNEHPWHYFEEVDSISSVHDSLPAVLDTVISKLDKVRTIKVPLDEEQAKNYYGNFKFIFKGKELETCKSLKHYVLVLQRIFIYLMYFSLTNFKSETI